MLIIAPIEKIKHDSETFDGYLADFVVTFSHALSQGRVKAKLAFIRPRCKQTMVAKSTLDNLCDC